LRRNASQPGQAGSLRSSFRKSSYKFSEILRRELLGQFFQPKQTGSEVFATISSSCLRDERTAASAQTNMAFFAIPRAKIGYNIFSLWRVHPEPEEAKVAQNLRSPAPSTPET
jgi:hypothetical protein